MSVKINNYNDYNDLDFGVKNIFSSKSCLLIYPFILFYFDETLFFLLTIWFSLNKNLKWEK